MSIEWGVDLMPVMTCFGCPTTAYSRSHGAVPCGSEQISTGLKRKQSIPRHLELDLDRDGLSLAAVDDPLLLGVPPLSIADELNLLLASIPRLGG